MAFINVKLGDAQEQKPVPDGAYDLRIVKFEDKKSKKGNEMTVATIKVDDSRYPNAELINHYLVYPDANTKPETAQLFLRNNARFLQAFGVPYDDTGFNSDDLLGATASQVLLIQEEGDDGVPRNKLQLPRMKD